MNRLQWKDNGDKNRGSLSQAVLERRSDWRLGGTGLRVKSDGTGGNSRAWVIAALMGLGHLRAAYALRSIAQFSIIIEASSEFASADEIRIWKFVRRLYYRLSHWMESMMIRILISRLFNRMMAIPPMTAGVDGLRPTWGQRWLHWLIVAGGFGKNLVDHLSRLPLPMIHTFYMTAMAQDYLGLKSSANFLMICDSDINRIWTPICPSNSQIRYWVPCSQAADRLISYGISPDRITYTGFPLPVENIGHPKRMEILKSDLFKRLVRLDQKRVIVNRRGVLGILQPHELSIKDPFPVTLMVSIGGAGAQSGLVIRILEALRMDIVNQRIRVILSAGIHTGIYRFFLRYLSQSGLSRYLGKELVLCYHPNTDEYFREFNQWLRETDILWTKPSELSFYCGLGIPVIIAPHIGPHEKSNRDWLISRQSGIEAPTDLKRFRNWLVEMIEGGKMAECAWNGFIRCRKLGSYRMAKMVEEWARERKKVK